VSELNASVAALSSTLDEERETYVSLVALAGREERAIVAGDVEELTDVTDRQEQLMELLATLETERMTALTAIAAATGLDADSLTVTMVASLADAEQGAALAETGAELRAQAVALQRANESNAALLQNSRQIVERWIQYLRTIVTGTLTYTAEGSPDEAGGNRVIDRSA
jgi:flagellar biosynthesis/type III secretory pathway chaperone